MPDLVDVIVEDDRWLNADISALSQTSCAATLAELDLQAHDFEIALLACDDARITALNIDFRDKSSATNVLSWPSDDLASKDDGALPSLPHSGVDFPQELGDIAISFDTCVVEAKAQNKALQAHVSHLLVHGCLHLLGYDHIREKDAALMEGLEVAILAKIGIADPY